MDGERETLKTAVLDITSKIVWGDKALNVLHRLKRSSYQKNYTMARKEERCLRDWVLQNRFHNSLEKLSVQVTLDLRNARAHLNELCGDRSVRAILDDL